MKICMLTSSYPRFEGDFAGTFVQSLAEAVAREGHEVHVLAARDPNVQMENRQSPVRLHYFSYAPLKRLHVMGYARSLKSDIRLRKEAFFLLPAYIACAVARLVRLHQRERFDLIHAHWMIPGGFIGALASRITGLPLIISLHGSDVFVGGLNPVFRQCGRWTLTSAQAVSACSKTLRERADAIVGHDTGIQIVPYGVDLNKFGDAAPEDVARLRRSMQIEKCNSVVLALGRLVEKKGFKYLVESIPLVLRDSPKAMFVFAGDGDAMESLKSKCRSLGILPSTRFPGAVSWNDVATYMALADIVVIPSIRDQSGNIDGLPNVLLEAMASGKSVVASSVAGIPEIVRNGMDGLLVDEKSPQHLAKAISSLLESPSRRIALGDSARTRVACELSWSTIARQFSAMYGTVTEGRSFPGRSQIPVSDKTYSTDYFLSECEGHVEFGKNLGQTPSPRLQHALRVSTVTEGMSVLDLGCGRGEVVLNCAKVGALAVGVDYSQHALDLSRAAIASLDGTTILRAGLVRSDAKDLPFERHSFDRVLMLDIIEHLRPWELDAALREVRRVLKPEGILVVHTMPNLWYYRYGYPVFRFFQRLRGNLLPHDPRDRWKYVRSVHVNEQDIITLRTTLQRAGFEPKIWLANVENGREKGITRVCKKIVARVFPLSLIFCNDIFAVAVPSASRGAHGENSSSPSLPGQRDR